MGQLVAFNVGGGQAVVAEINDDEPGIQRAARVDETLVRSAARLDAALEQVRGLAELTMDKLNGLSKWPETVEIEFGSG